MDLTESIVPRSDQINADDLIAGPITYTIREVRKGAAEQPFDFMLVETERAYRPSKTMRRVIVAAWGSDSAAYIGRRLTLYREPTIRFGKDEVGGIRISHMSGIGKLLEVKAQVSRGKRETFTIEPLPEVAPVDPRIAKLTAEWRAADPERRKAIEAEVAALKAASATTEPAPNEPDDDGVPQSLLDEIARESS
jgi:hypothetical protein